MATEKTKAFQFGKNVTVTVPEAVADQVTSAFSEAFGRGARSRRSARPAPQRLSVDRIVDVAIAQMRDHGYDAVTMRSIAKELGTGPASLYAHVANREELDALVLDRVAQQWELPEADPATWDDQIRAALHSLLELYRANPGVARAAMGMIPLQPGALVGMERLLAMLRAGEVPAQASAWFLDIMGLYVATVAIEEDIWRRREEHGGMVHDHDTHKKQVEGFLRSLPADHFPILSGMAAVMARGSGDDRFAFGVELLVSGLKAMSAADEGRGPDQPGPPLGR